jgi:hypothetical protein
MQAKECLFDAGSQKKTLVLKYRNLDRDTFSEKIGTINYGDDPRRISWSSFGKNALWVKIPSFATNDNNISAMRGLVAEMANQRSNHLVVFDVRGNGGGDSEWGLKILSALLGKEYIVGVENKAEGEAYAEIRVSSGNIQQYEGWLARAENHHGAESVIYREIFQSLDLMKKALTNKQAYSRQANLEAKELARATPATALSQAKIVALTDGGCGSACLNFLDLLYQIPNFTQVGQTTFADSVYTELRQVVLPSELGTLNFPTKVWRNRHRGHNVEYKPQIPWKGRITDTEALKSWINGLFLEKS